MRVGVILLPRAARVKRVRSLNRYLTAKFAKSATGERCIREEGRSRNLPSRS